MFGLVRGPMRHRPPRQTIVLPGSIAPVVMCTIMAIAGCGGKTTPVPDLSSSALGAAGPLLNSVSSAVTGLSHTQSALGVGSLLGLAKAKMAANQFSQISDALPGSDALIGEAVNKGLPTCLGGFADVTDFLSESGISSGQVGRMIPILGNAVSGKVSPEVATAFMSALW
jgi:Protein of unknown function VcgC/VcgE (DUF2780)